ncbi:MAG TPA: hypothetical protein VFS19_05370 [Planctomycetota bacterium]|nr:hypothetical protein [Planctomycetota bacterium]
MRLIAAVVAAFAAIALAPAARAQETDEQIKKRILDKVRERLQEEKKTILDRLSKVIDEELSGAPKKDPDAAPAAPKGADPRMRDLERKLQKLNDERDDLMRDIRAIRRETEDARIIRDAKRNGPQSRQEAGDEFQEYFNLHTEATKELESDKEKAAKGFEKSIAGFKRLYYALKDDATMGGTAVPSAYNVACGYALMGKATEAIDWLQISIDAGYKDWDHIREDSDFTSIRKERRFLRMLADR